MTKRLFAEGGDNNNKPDQETQETLGAGSETFKACPLKVSDRSDQWCCCGVVVVLLWCCCGVEVRVPEGVRFPASPLRKSQAFCVQEKTLE